MNSRKTNDFFRNPPQQKMYSIFFFCIFCIQGHTENILREMCTMLKRGNSWCRKMVEFKFESIVNDINKYGSPVSLCKDIRMCVV